MVDLDTATHNYHNTLHSDFDMLALQVCVLLVHHGLQRLPQLKGVVVPVGAAQHSSSSSSSRNGLMPAGMCYFVDTTRNSQRGVVLLTDVDGAALDRLYPPKNSSSRGSAGAAGSSSSRTHKAHRYFATQLGLCGAVIQAALEACQQVDVLIPLCSNPTQDKAVARHHVACVLTLNNSDNNSPPRSAAMNVYDSLGASAHELSRGRVEGLCDTLTRWLGDRAEWGAAGGIGITRVVPRYHALGQQWNNNRCGLYTADNLLQLACGVDLLAPTGGQDRSGGFAARFAGAWQDTQRWLREHYAVG